MGVGIEASALDFVPDLLDSYLHTGFKIDEFRVPHPDYSETPKMKFEEPLDMAFGGDFAFFAAQAAAEFDANTLHEAKQQYVSAKGEMNLLNKAQIGGELHFNRYDEEWWPDRIAFSVGSDAVGIFPPAPILELGGINGGINNLGKSVKAGGTWNYLPPLTIELSADIELYLKLVGLGLNGAGITFGPTTVQTNLFFRHPLFFSAFI